ncbi:transglycosylase SLT domain-containing protein [Vulgatibacter sp.]|uniref:transglycosylase SLT domain-containing protein n=1 Tax=Vulgatibacter sp. TaxID=1971226 RepID=UPI0035655A45
MKVRARWPLRAIGLLAFGTAAAMPWSITPSPKPVVPHVAVDPEIERVARYLEWRAPVSIDPLLRRQVATAVVEEARRAGFDSLFILAVMEVESDFLPDAVSNANARGLLQLRAVTLKEIARHEELPEKAAFEPESVANLRFGIRYLAMMERRFRTRERALAAWNAGPGAVEKALSETGEVPERWLAFARKVNREHRRLRTRLGTEAPTTMAQAPRAAIRAE